MIIGLQRVFLALAGLFAAWWLVVRSNGLGYHPLSFALHHHNLLMLVLHCIYRCVFNLRGIAARYAYLDYTLVLHLTDKTLSSHM